MRFAIILSAFIASAFAVDRQERATPVQRDDLGGFRSIQPPRLAAGKRDAVADGYRSIQPPRPGSAGAKREVNSPVSGRDTNAKRLAAGLPLLRPHRRFNPLRPHAPRQTSSVCTNGVIQVTDGTNTGYISNQLNDYGEYSNTVTTACDSNALVVCAVTGQPTLVQSITTVNGVSGASEPFFGATAGFAGNGNVATLGEGSENYVYITNSAQSDASVDNTSNSFSDVNSIPEPAESEIWTVAADGSMTLTWTNPDGSTVATTLLESQDTFVATADVNEYETNFGPADDITFVFMPSPAC